MQRVTGISPNTIDCIKERITKQGVNFEQSPTIKETIDGFAGPASEEILKLIRQPAPPPPEVPRTAGILTVTCVPECSVVVNGTVRSTRNGRVEIEKLPVGRQTLVVYKEGYQLYSKDLEFRNGQPEIVEAPLQKNPEDPALRQMRLNALLWTLSSTSGKADTLQGRGGLYWTGEGKTPSWGMGFSTKAGADPQVSFSNTTGGSCSIKVVGQKTNRKPCDKLNTDKERDAVKAAALFMAYEPNDLIPGLLKMNLTSADGDPRRLRTADGADSYVVLVDENGLLQEVKHRTQNESWTIQYSEYKDLEKGKGRYPMRMVIGQDGANGRWEFRWTSVQ